MFKKIYIWLRLRFKRKGTIDFQPQINISKPLDVQKLARDMERLRSRSPHRFSGNVTTSRPTMRGHTHQSAIDPLHPANPSSPLNQIETFNHHSVGSCGSRGSDDYGSNDGGGSNNSNCD